MELCITKLCVILTFCYQVQAIEFEHLYQAVTKVETGNEANQFIRTKKDKNSTAYGPVQITGGLASDFRIRYPDLFNREEHEYLRRYEVQSSLFLKYGRNKHKPGYARKYDYGGIGILGGTRDRQLYYSVSRKIMRRVWINSGQDLNRFVRAWNGKYNPGYVRKLKRYMTAFERGFYKAAEQQPMTPLISTLQQNNGATNVIRPKLTGRYSDAASMNRLATNWNNISRSNLEANPRAQAMMLPDYRHESMPTNNVSAVRPKNEASLADALKLVLGRPEPFMSHVRESINNPPTIDPKALAKWRNQQPR